LPLDALVGRGVLRRDERKVPGIFPADRYPGVVTGPEDAVRTRLRSVVLDGASADESTAALVSVTRAADMVKQLFPGLDRVRAQGSGGADEGDLGGRLGRGSRQAGARRDVRRYLGGVVAASSGAAVAGAS
jgi:hypothetical protein